MNALEKRIFEYYSHVDRSVAVSSRSGLLSVDTVKTDVISDLFAPEAVYERQGWAPFVGKKAIDGFFHDQRALCGSHTIEGITLKDGVNAVVADGMREYFPALEAKNCTTITVEGHFTGAQCHEDRSEGKRFVQAVSGVTLPFKDYWVMARGQIVFRYSQIGTAQERAETLRSNQHRERL